MAWRIKATEYESCSCKMVCRCLLGPAEPDQGWCSAALVFSVEEGEAEGVDLAGAKVAVALDLPGDFLGGIDNAKLFFDAKKDQREQLEMIFQGKRGGVFEGLAAGIRNWLPSDDASIEISGGDKVAIQIGDTAKLALERLKTQAGEQAVLENSPIGAALGFGRIELAMGSGSRAAPAGMRDWESFGYGATTRFEQSG